MNLIEKQNKPLNSPAKMQNRAVLLDRKILEFNIKEKIY